MSEGVATAHQIKIDEFEGPYDLLLQLVHDNELDITSISLAAVTEQFVKYVQSNEVPAEQQADFVVVASTLLLIKLREYLPGDDQEEIEELAQKLSAYAPLREQAKYFVQSWKRAVLSAGTAPTPSEQHVSWKPESVPEAMQRVLARLVVSARPTRHLRPRSQKTLEHYRGSVRNQLKERTQLLFTELQAQHTQDSSSLLLALLEMARWAEVELDQREPFGEIAIQSFSSPKVGED